MASITVSTHKENDHESIMLLLSLRLFYRQFFIKFTYYAQNYSCYKKIIANIAIILKFLIQEAFVLARVHNTVIRVQCYHYELLVLELCNLILNALLE